MINDNEVKLDESREKEILLWLWEEGIEHTTKHVHLQLQKDKSLKELVPPPGFFKRLFMNSSSIISYELLMFDNIQGKNKYLKRFEPGSPLLRIKPKTKGDKKLHNFNKDPNVKLEWGKIHTPQGDFDCLQEAADALGIEKTTVTARIKSDNWGGYTRDEPVEVEKKPLTICELVPKKGMKIRWGKIHTPEGTFDTLRAAAAKTSLSRAAIGHRIRSGDYPEYTRDESIQVPVETVAKVDPQDKKSRVPREEKMTGKPDNSVPIGVPVNFDEVKKPITKIDTQKGKTHRRHLKKEVPTVPLKWQTPYGGFKTLKEAADAGKVSSSQLRQCVLKSVPGYTNHTLRQENDKFATPNGFFTTIRQAAKIDKYSDAWVYAAIKNTDNKEYYCLNDEEDEKAEVVIPDAVELPIEPKKSSGNKLKHYTKGPYQTPFGIFDTLKEAGIACDMDGGSVNHRVHSKKYPEYYSVKAVEEKKEPVTGIFDSLKEAGKALGGRSSTVGHRVNDPKNPGFYVDGTPIEDEKPRANNDQLYKRALGTIYTPFGEFETIFEAAQALGMDAYKVGFYIETKVEGYRIGKYQAA